MLISTTLIGLSLIISLTLPTFKLHLFGFLIDSISPMMFPETDDFSNARSQLGIKGRIYGGKFVFRGNTIVFDSNPRVEPLWPKDITVDGRPWKDLSQPFELDFTPDFAKTVIVEREIARQRQFRLYSAFPEREFALYVEDAQPRGSIDPELRNISVELFPFQVKLAVKNQIPHLEVLWKYAWQPQTGKDASPSGSPEPNYSITITPAGR